LSTLERLGRERLLERLLALLPLHLPSFRLPSLILPSLNLPSFRLPSPILPSLILPSLNPPSFRLPSLNLPSMILPSPTLPSPLLKPLLLTLPHLPIMRLLTPPRQLPCQCCQRRHCRHRRRRRLYLMPILWSQCHWKLATNPTWRRQRRCLRRCLGSSL
jgi:hypothetical protein